MYTTCKVQLAITSVRKVRFQLFKHFSVANNELVQMMCSTQKLFFTQNACIMDINPWYECEKWSNFSRKKYLS